MIVLCSISMKDISTEKTIQTETETGKLSTGGQHQSETAILFILATGCQGDTHPHCLLTVVRENKHRLECSRLECSRLECSRLECSS